MMTVPEIIELCLLDTEHKYIMYDCWYNEQETHDIYLFPLRYVAADIIYEMRY